jgi:hypothetical protein
VGPNLYAIAAGARGGVAGGVGTNVAIGGTMALSYEYEMLSRLNAKLGPVVAQILAKGPTALCLLHANAR